MNIVLKSSEIVDFALEHSGYYYEVERDDLIRFCEAHIAFGTIYYLPGKAMARWNVLPDGKTLHVIDLIIHPEYRNLRMLRFIALQIWKLNPKTESFYYDREKHGEKSSYGYSVKDWFKLKEKSNHGRKI